MRTDYGDAATSVTCARKKAYPDEKTAEKIARRITYENRNLDPTDLHFNVNVVAYGCTRCGRYHVGRGG